MNLTPNEQAAALVLLQECLHGMGGKVPADLADDPYTWTDAQTLIDNGWTAAEAAGTYGSLIEKGIVTKDADGDFMDWEAVAPLWPIWEQAGKVAEAIRTQLAETGAEQLATQKLGDEVEDLKAALVKAGAAEEAAKAMGIPFPGIICATLRSHAETWTGPRKTFIATAQLAGFNKATAATQWQRARKGS